MKITIEVDEKKYISLANCKKHGMELGALENAILNGEVVDESAPTKLYYCAVHFVLPHCRKTLHRLQTVLFAESEEQAMEKFTEKNSVWIEQLKQYREFRITINEQPNGMFIL